MSHMRHKIWPRANGSTTRKTTVETIIPDPNPRFETRDSGWVGRTGRPIARFPAYGRLRNPGDALFIGGIETGVAARVRDFDGHPNGLMRKTKP